MIFGSALEVGAGAEDLAGAGQHDDAHLVHLRDAVQRQRQFVVQHARQRVDRRAVHRQCRDVVGDADLQLGEVVHGVS